MPRKTLIEKLDAPNYEIAQRIAQKGFPNYQLFLTAKIVDPNLDYSGFKLLKSINAPNIVIAKKMLINRFSSYSEYREAAKMGVSTYQEYELIKKYKAPDLLTARAIQKGEFPDYSTYLKAKKVNTDTMSQYKKVLKFKAPDYETVIKIEKGNFPDYATYQKAKVVGVSNLEELTIVMRYQAPDLQTARAIQKGEFPDYSEYQEAAKMGVSTYQEYELIKKYKAPDYETVVKIEKGNFPDFTTYQKAKAVGASNLEELTIVMRYQAKDLTTALIQQEIEFLEKLYNLSKSKYIWDSFLISECLSVPRSKTFEIIRDLLSKGKLKGRFKEDSHPNFSFISAMPTESEIIRLNDYIKSTREGIPISLSQISRKTGIEETRCEQVLKIITSEKHTSGEYLELEGVFIKSGRTMEALGDLLTNITLPAFYCQLCGERHKAGIPRLQCQSCGRYVCTSSFQQMKQVGRTVCPMCNGLLVKFTPE